jgi:hypothetical protein
MGNFGLSNLGWHYKFGQNYEKFGQNYDLKHKNFIKYNKKIFLPLTRQILYSSKVL